MRAYKHHIASDFINDPTLIKNNGGGKGGAIFFDFQNMMDCLSYAGVMYWYCELEVNEGDFIPYFENGNIAILLKDIDAIGDFKPLPYWGY